MRQPTVWRCHEHEAELVPCGMDLIESGDGKPLAVQRRYRCPRPGCLHRRPGNPTPPTARQRASWRWLRTQPGCRSVVTAKSLGFEPKPPSVRRAAPPAVNEAASSSAATWWVVELGADGEIEGVQGPFEVPAVVDPDRADDMARALRRAAEQHLPGRIFQIVEAAGRPGPGALTAMPVREQRVANTSASEFVQFFRHERTAEEEAAFFAASARRR